MLGLLAVFSLLNVATDSIYQYERVSMFHKVKKGHRIAAGVICFVFAINAVHHHKK